jgi:decaprenyl-phosphate phosphoribosyltransferase
MLRGKIKSLIRLARPKHYIKNGLIALPLIFSGGLLDWSDLTKVFYGIAVFSLAASIVYIINDIQDREKDRQHPKKKYRPIASGAVTVKEAAVFAFLLGVIVIAVGIAGTFSVFAWLLLGIYVLINIVYSAGLKNVPIFDVALLALGFVIRVVFGGEIVGVEVSQWLYLTILAGSFYLGLGKRRNELITNGSKSRKVNESYSVEFLDKNMYVCMTLVLVFYSLWATDPDRSSLLYLTIPLLMLFFMDYSKTVEDKTSSGDPVDVLTSNKSLLFFGALYLVTTIWIVYQ